MEVDKRFEVKGNKVIDNLNKTEIEVGSSIEAIRLAADIKKMFRQAKRS
jgi:hypothetical protein